MVPTFRIPQCSLHGSLADAEKPGYAPDAFAALPELHHPLIPRRSPQPLLPSRLLLHTSRQRATQTSLKDLTALIPPVDFIRQQVEFTANHDKAILALMFYLVKAILSHFGPRPEGKSQISISKSQTISNPHIPAGINPRWMPAHPTTLFKFSKFEGPCDPRLSLRALCPMSP